MKSAIRGIVILRITVHVERPTLHGRVAPVVRKTQHDRVTRAAVRTVDVGIAVARVVRIKKFVQAVIADRKIGRDANRRADFAVGCHES